MMRIAMAMAGLTLLTGAALAAPPSAEQKAEFYATCMGISGDQPLCSCKADAAMTLIDQRFMDVVISGMQGKAPASADYAAYNTYVGKSNQVCKPNY